MMATPQEERIRNGHRKGSVMVRQQETTIQRNNVKVVVRVRLMVTGQGVMATPQEERSRNCHRKGSVMVRQHETTIQRHNGP